MIQLVMIGNGFDLAHGNKTNYSDFFLYIIKKYYKTAQTSNFLSFNNDIVDIKASNYSNDYDDIDNFEVLLSMFKNIDVKIKYKNNFLNEIASDIANRNWTNIENLYFKNLTYIYMNGVSIEDKIKELNKSFDFIKSELIDYLSQIKINQPIDSFKIIFKKIINQTDSKEQLIFLNFNYTDTLSNYSKFIKYEEYYEIKIHGSINKPESIIFGYGDEDHSLYSKLEDANQNYILDHFKSLHYIKSNNYSKLFELLDMDPKWHIHVVGHSCGISDRILLKELFDNDNCKKITIYPYRRKDGTYDITEKVQQISRHFSGNSKHKMRKIISYDNDCIIN